ncbi:MAG: septum formation family protein [Pseudomonadota bacterium]|nr:septum formation family protein [Pseudomonadota bacterium]
MSDTITEKLELDHQDVFKLKLGQCFDDTNGHQQSVDSLPIRDCTQPHDHEIYHIFNVNLDSYNDEEIEQQANARCEEAFQRFTQKNYNESIYEMSYLSPSVESWQAQDREVICYIQHPDQKTTGSLRNIQA